MGWVGGGVASWHCGHGTLGVFRASGSALTYSQCGSACVGHHEGKKKTLGSFFYFFIFNLEICSDWLLGLSSCSPGGRKTRKDVSCQSVFGGCKL